MRWNTPRKSEKLWLAALEAGEPIEPTEPSDEDLIALGRLVMTWYEAEHVAILPPHGLSANDLKAVQHLPSEIKHKMWIWAMEVYAETGWATDHPGRERRLRP